MVPKNHWTALVVTLPQLAPEPQGKAAVFLSGLSELSLCSTSLHQVLYEFSL